MSCLEYYVPRERMHQAIRDLTQYVVTGPPRTSRRVPVEFFRMTVHGLVVPLAYLGKVGLPVNHDDIVGVSMTTTCTLRPPQEEVVRNALNMVHAQRAVTIVAPTGSGKTVMAIDLISRMGMKTVVFCHKTFLIEQWKERLETFSNVSVSVCSGSNMDLSGDVILFMIQTFLAKNMSMPVGVGLVVIDECHHVAASTFKHTLLRGRPAYVVGLSATPDRADGIKIDLLTGDFITYPEDGRVDGSRVVVRIYNYNSSSYRLPPPVTKQGTVNYAALISALTEDHSRSRYIASIVNRLVGHDKGVHVLVLTHRRRHVDDLVALLDHSEAFIPGSRRVPNSRVVVSTFQYASEGFDRSDLNTVVFATPVKDTRQAIGRILRQMHHPDHTPVVLDIVDAWGSLRHMARSRRRMYHDANYTVMHEKDEVSGTGMISFLDD